jgi:hypothetical protein
MFVIVELLCGTWGWREGKENDEESRLSKYIYLSR